MFEFAFHLGPLHLTFSLTDPPGADGYNDLSSDYELAADEDEPEQPEGRVGFRHN